MFLFHIEHTILSVSVSDLQTAVTYRYERISSSHVRRTALVFGERKRVAFVDLKSVWDPGPRGRLDKGCRVGRIAAFDYGFYRFHERIEVIEWPDLDTSLHFDRRDSPRIQNKRQVLFIGRFENC